VTASNNCGTATDSVEASLLFPPSVNLGNDTALCDFSNFGLSGGSADLYSWSTGSSDSSISIHAPGTYWVSASNSCGTSSDTILITPCEAIYLLPSAFSPNNDGINDLLSLIRIGDATLINFTIFNRWGQLIFETSDDTQSWNGMFRNRKEEIGVYIFTLRFRDDNTGKESMQAGDITLIR
jgi:gliding motility-associated-like protein